MNWDSLLCGLSVNCKAIAAPAGFPWEQALLPAPLVVNTSSEKDDDKVAVSAAAGIAANPWEGR